MVAWIEPDKLTLHHARDGKRLPGPTNRCGPLVPPDLERALAKRAKKKQPMRVRLNEVRRASPGKRKRVMSRQSSWDNAPDRDCEVCGEKLERKTYASGAKEKWDKFVVRRTCGRRCGAKLRSKTLKKGRSL